MNTTDQIFMFVTGAGVIISVVLICVFIAFGWAFNLLYNMAKAINEVNSQMLDKLHNSLPQADRFTDAFVNVLNAVQTAKPIADMVVNATPDTRDNVASDLLFNHIEALQKQVLELQALLKGQGANPFSSAAVQEDITPKPQ